MEGEVEDGRIVERESEKELEWKKAEIEREKDCWKKEYYWLVEYISIFA